MVEISPDEARAILVKAGLYHDLKPDNARCDYRSWAGRSTSSIYRKLLPLAQQSELKPSECAGTPTKGVAG